MKGILFAVCIATALSSLAQVTVTPSITPALFRPTDEITVTYDVTGTSLAGLSNAYIWVWSPTPTIDGKYNINPANSNATTSTAMFTKSTADGKTIFSITFKPSEFFTQDISTRQSLGMLLKGNDWANGQTTDFVTTFWDGESYELKLNSPLDELVYVPLGGQISILAEVPVTSSFSLYENNVLVDEQEGSSSYQYLYNANAIAGPGTLKLVATDGGNTSEVLINFFVYESSAEEPRPAGIVPGINYGIDETRVTLCLWAPNKSSVYVRGDFTSWSLKPEMIMKKDGEYFWLEVEELTAGAEYGFQYLLDGKVVIADPYADKILDPDDQYIPEAVYPSLKEFPAGAVSNKWYFNRVSVLQTGQTPFDWKNTNVARPDKDELIIYELLIRDFFGDGNRSYQSLIDTIPYFKRLGVNAIELMPVMEFNGNDSWGYNPAFMFAPDKYYGPKDKLKEFIDKCHGEGIAVILDIALNHQDIPNPYAMMDFDFNTGKPTEENKFFNVQARHPYNVFHDMNHESLYTQAYVDTINHYWLNEFNVDGFRFDLTKGFTQNERCGGSTSNEACIGQKDDSRIAILKRMADAIWTHSPGAIIILEHFAANEEEKILAEYRAEEGKGMMLWGNVNGSYSQLTMGYMENSDISRVSHQSRGWAYPHLVSYMESHDEERMNYRNKKFGNVFKQYSAKDPSTSLERIKAAATLFYTVPGPKMIWEFGEVGYDFSINTCADLTENNNCRVSVKPVTWDYFDESERFGLFLHTANLINLHTQYSVFTMGTPSIVKDSLITDIQIKNSPYADAPASTSQMNVQAIANLHLREKAAKVNFPHAGTWYDYYDGGKAVIVTTLPHSIVLQPGEYKIFTDVPIGQAPVTSAENNLEAVRVFPNPVTDQFHVNLPEGVSALRDGRGVEVPFKVNDKTYDVRHLEPGLYFLQHRTRAGKTYHLKIMKR
jgi:1,4-alpha-glucan branching enzyme